MQILKKMMQMNLFKNQNKLTGIENKLMVIKVDGKMADID